MLVYACVWEGGVGVGVGVGVCMRTLKHYIQCVCVCVRIMKHHMKCKCLCVCVCVCRCVEQQNISYSLCVGVRTITQHILLLHWYHAENVNNFWQNKFEKMTTSASIHNTHVHSYILVVPWKESVSVKLVFCS